VFFHFSQNNSGGSFDYDGTRGISVNVIIEAADVDEANFRAEQIGLYFDGVDEGNDCGCCGDRWYEAWGTGDETPSIYGKPVGENVPIVKWMAEGTPEAFVHYANGVIVGIEFAVRKH
jgi:hypothetical protein